MSSSDLSLVSSGIFAFIMLVYWTGAFFILYHLIRFGVGPNPKRTAVIFLAGSLFLSMVLVLLYGQLPIASLLSN